MAPATPPRAHKYSVPPGPLRRLRVSARPRTAARETYEWDIRLPRVNGALMMRREEMPNGELRYDFNVCALS